MENINEDIKFISYNNCLCKVIKVNFITENIKIHKLKIVSELKFKFHIDNMEDEAPLTNIYHQYPDETYYYFDNVIDKKCKPQVIKFSEVQNVLPSERYDEIDYNVALSNGRFYYLGPSELNYLNKFKWFVVKFNDEYINYYYKSWLENQRRQILKGTDFEKIQLLNENDKHFLYSLARNAIC